MKRHSFEPYDEILKYTLMKFGTGLKAIMENDFRLSWFAQTIFSISETINFKTLISLFQKHFPLPTSKIFSILRKK